MKKLYFVFLSFILFFINISVYSFSLPVEEVFSDIDKSYPYYRELQTLYDRGMIVPDSSGKFNPKQLLNRDDFVGILVEVSCEKCIQPNVSSNLLTQHKDTELFFDISKSNKNYYCIAEAKEKKYVKWYEVSSVCNDGSSRNWEIPFCPNNNIILEEALAIVMRASGIMSISEEQNILNQIQSGRITEPLSWDVTTHNTDWKINSFYPYIQKALNYEVVDYDANGNKYTYPLLEKTGNFINPKKNINKEEFLKIAFVALKSNSCYEKKENTLAVAMEILDKICQQWQLNCSKAITVWNEDTFDFKPLLGVPDNNKNQYIWRFQHPKTWEIFNKYNKYVDNQLLKENGKWNIFLRVIAPNGDTWEANGQIYIWDNNANQDDAFLWYIEADPLIGHGPLSSQFKAVTVWWKGPFTFEWDFGDGSRHFGNNINHIYYKQWTYKVTLRITDTDWKIINASVIISVTSTNCDIDSDKDWISNCNDLCPNTIWDIKNSGCPIFETLCSIDSQCDNGFYCSSKGICETQTTAISCNYTGWDIIFWNAVCSSCPCNYNFDFNADLRKCDVIFPAITSPEWNIIYNRWEYYEIR